MVHQGFAPYLVPLTLAILVTLFLFQYKGTAGVASLFAPVTFVWFAILGIMGVVHIFDDLEILFAFNPAHGLSMLIDRPGLALLVFGGVFLAVTGGEALYADMGHFGSKPIRLAWLSVVFPGLILNYLGQGAFIISHPQSVENPFFLMVEGWLVIPLVILATAVTVIASQAVITGAFSIAQQAMSLGLFPRMSITHTSETEHGQIYVAQINWMLLVGVVILVLVFKSSGNLASAYGIAVNTSMVVDSILAAIFFWKARSLPRWFVLPAIALIMVIEVVFLAANGLKLAHGGYMPVLLGASIILLMFTWMRGRQALGEKLRKEFGRTGSPARKPGAPAADAGCWCCRVPADGPRLCAKRPHAQSEAQPRAARQARLHHRRNDERTEDRPGRAGARQAVAAGCVAGGGPLRLHGAARRAQGAPRLRALRPRDRSAPGILFPRPPRHSHVGALVASVLAAAAVHHDGQPVCPRHRILPHPA